MKTLLYLAAFALLFTACTKQKATPAPTQTLKDKMIGKWNIVSVTTLFRDSLRDSIGSKVYPEPKGYYFKFNDNGTWLENLDASNTTDVGISGNYTLDSDSGFTLHYPQNTITTPCKVPTISGSKFIFTHERSTLFNGVTPGFIEYIFLLSRDS